jgi:hypothetical protein
LHAEGGVQPAITARGFVYMTVRGDGLVEVGDDDLEAVLTALFAAA